MKNLDPHVEAFESNRSVLTGVAYRMLGSVSDAEDMVQEAWLRWSAADASTVAAPRSWLLTVVSRLCLDRMKSARVQREQYYGTWLPDPLVNEAGLTDLLAPSAIEVDESVSIALMLVLEKLSPVERAGFLLHEVFGHTFDEIAEILDKPAVNCRKLVSRARDRVRAEKPRFKTTNREHEELLKRFLEASRAGEMGPLMDLLSENVSLHSDGGGKALAVPTVMRDREQIAKFFVRITENQQRSGEVVEDRFVSFNGSPGVLLCIHGQPETAMSLEVHDGKIAAIYAHRNPDKLKWFESSSL